MAALAIHLPVHDDQTEFNLRRWEEVLADPTLAKLEQRIETDRHGHIIMSPPPASPHSDSQSDIHILLHQLLPNGKARVEIPISTPDGIRAADVAWTSDVRLKIIYDKRAYREAPDICVEVVSPKNTVAELAEQRALYFESGAHEVWFCTDERQLQFFSTDAPSDALQKSKICPDFPAQLD
jgi:Uma2 family endonuclease